MAKEYKGKITLQDNFTEVVSKAIKQTQQLQKEFKKIEKLKANPKVSVDIDENAMAIAKKDLAKLSKNKVKIKATLDSSFNSTMNTINKATAQNKTIKITAEENVTRTVKNLQRDIFTVERKLKTSILGGGRFSGSGFSGNITTSSPDIVSTLNQGFSKLVKGNSNRTNVSNGDAGTIIRDLVTNGLGTSAAMGLAGLSAANMSKAIRAGVVRIDSGKVDVDALKPSLANAIKGGWKDAVTRAYNKRNNIIGDGEALRDADFGFKYNRFVYAGDSEFSKLVKGQKDEMAATRAKYGLGSKDYLSKYKHKTFSHAISPDEDVHFTGMAKKANKAQIAIMDGFAKVRGSVKSVMSSISNTVSSVFNNKMINSVKGFVTKSKGHFTVLRQALGHSIQRGAYHASTSVSGLILKFAGLASKGKQAFNGIGLAIKVMRGKASLVPAVFGKWAHPLNLVLKTVGKVGSAIGKIASKATRIAFNMTGNALKFSAKVLANVTKAVAAAAGGLVFKGIMDGALNEQYEVSMLHFIQNAGGTIKDRDNYMNDAIKLANKTPFSTNEVLEAANRGIGVAGGNTKQASSLLKLAADMAALTPGKTVMDAMEALADLKLGERERMKEFGFKIDNDEFVKAAGLSSGNIADLTPEQMEKAFATLTNGETGIVGKYFEGGAAKIANTFKGQISTFTGQFGSAFADLGRIITEPLIEPLKTVNSKLEKFATTMKNFKDGVLGGSIPNPFVKWKDFLGWAGKDVNKDNPIAQFALTIAPAVSTVISLITMLKNSFESVFGRIKVALQQAYKPFDDLFGSIEQRAPWVQGIFDVLANVVAIAMEVIGSVMQNTYTIIKPILEWIGTHSEEINTIFEALGKITKATCDIIAGAFEVLWPILEPILDELLELITWITEGLGVALPAAAKGLGKVLGGIVKFFTPVINAFTTLVGLIDDVIVGIGKLAKNVGTDIVGNVKDFFGGDDYNKNGRAVGQAYIPYNGYKASLHRGEAILTRQEADAWRAGRTSGGNSNNTTQNITINVNGAADANVVAKKVAMELQKAAMNM